MMHPSLTIREIQTPEELKTVFPILQELRTNLTWDSFYKLYSQARETSRYTLVGYFEGDQCQALMGYRILYDFVHAKHLYIDDLVTAEKYRSKGIGATLLKWAENEATAQECNGLRLCTGIQNDSGKRFYEREGWTLRAIAFKKQIV